MRLYWLIRLHESLCLIKNEPQTQHSFESLLWIVFSNWWSSCCDSPYDSHVIGVDVLLSYRWWVNSLLSVVSVYGYLCRSFYWSLLELITCCCFDLELYICDGECVVVFNIRLIHVSYNSSYISSILYVSILLWLLDCLKKILVHFTMDPKIFWIVVYHLMILRIVWWDDLYIQYYHVGVIPPVPYCPPCDIIY